MTSQCSIKPASSLSCAVLPNSLNAVIFIGTNTVLIYGVERVSSFGKVTDCWLHSTETSKNAQLSRYQFITARKIAIAVFRPITQPRSAQKSTLHSAGDHSHPWPVWPDLNYSAFLYDGPYTHSYEKRVVKPAAFFQRVVSHLVRTVSTSATQAMPTEVYTIIRATPDVFLTRKAPRPDDSMRATMLRSL